jgi:hypothetical protein
MHRHDNIKISKSFHIHHSPVISFYTVYGIVHLSTYVIRHKKNETNPIAQEPRGGGDRQTDGYRTCSNLSQLQGSARSLYSVQVDTSSNIGMFLNLVRKCQTAKVNELTSI